MDTEQSGLSKLKPEFYTRDDAVEVARELLGKVLCSSIDGSLSKAVITETEAYAGVDDRASHAYGGRRTHRTEPMYAAGGVAYVYLCYGIHHLFNVVTGSAENPLAVLIRAGSPLAGIEMMLARRGKTGIDRTLLAGPGSLAQALGIRTRHTGMSLAGNTIWIEDHGIEISSDAIAVGSRIGIDYAGEDAARPYRFVCETVVQPSLDSEQHSPRDRRPRPGLP
jgi:DNA-3-methyladenine glycosylase